MDFQTKPTHLAHLAASFRMDSQRESELAAKDWAERAGYTVGQKQRTAPRGLMPSDEYFYVAKWRNMDHKERAALAGAIVFGSTWVEIWLRPGEHAAADDYVPPPASGMSCTPPLDPPCLIANVHHDLLTEAVSQAVRGWSFWEDGGEIAGPRCIGQLELLGRLHGKAKAEELLEDLVDHVVRAVEDAGAEPIVSDAPEGGAP